MISLSVTSDKSEDGFQLLAIAGVNYLMRYTFLFRAKPDYLHIGQYLLNKTFLFPYWQGYAFQNSCNNNSVMQWIALPKSDLTNAMVRVEHCDKVTWLIVEILVHPFVSALFIITS